MRPYAKEVIRYISLNIEEERSQWGLWVPVGLGIGISAYFSLHKEPPFTLSLPFFFLVMFLGYRIYKKTPLAKPYIVFIGCCMGGVLLSQWRTHSLNTPMLRSPVWNVTFEGTVEQYDVKNGRERLVLSTLIDPKKKLPIPLKKVKLSLKQGLETPSIGDTIKVLADLKPFAGPLLPGGYDYRRTAYFQGWGAHGYIKEIISKTPYRPHSFWNTIENLRLWINKELLRLIPKQSGAIAVALVTGERGYIEDHIRQAYTDAGIAHVLAISGLHLSLIAGMIFMLLGRGLSLSRYLVEKFLLKKVASLLTIPFLIIYLFLSGMGIPVIRSFIMISVVMIGIILDRQAISMRLLALAAIVILFFYPESIFSASFALSFGAVMGLLAVYQDGWSPFYRWGQTGGLFRKACLYLVGILITTLVASAVTTPISMYIFNRLSLQAILGNLIAIPLTGFLVMPLLLILMFTLPFGGQLFLGQCLSYAIEGLTKSAIMTANLPGASIPIPQASSLFIWLFVGGCLWLLLWKRPWRYAGLPIALGSFLTYLIPLEPFIAMDKRGTLMWYDGRALYGFMHQHNNFMEEMLQRHVGQDKTHLLPTDKVALTLKNLSVLLINLYPKGKMDLLEEYDLIVSQTFIPWHVAPNTEILSYSSRRQAQGLYIAFDKSSYDVFTSPELQGNRPWRA